VTLVVDDSVGCRLVVTAKLGRREGNSMVDGDDEAEYDSY
jgi:hypothetical protein